MLGPTTAPASTTVHVPLGRARGAGIDVVDVARLAAARHRIGPALEARICTPAERAALATDPAARMLDLAVLFGVKESVLKALGGIPAGGRFTDVDAGGVPGPGPCAAVLSGATAVRAGGRRLTAGTLPAPDGTVLVWAAAQDAAP